MACRAIFISSPGLSPCLQSFHAGTVNSSRTLVHLAPFSYGSYDTQIWRMRKVDFNVVLQSRTGTDVPKVDSLALKNVDIDKMGTVGVKFQRPYEMSLGKYIVREAVLNEEYWAAAWLRAESYIEEQPYLRYIDSYRKKFAEQEFTALKRRCSGRQGQSIKCICLVAVTSEESREGIGKFAHLTLRDRVVGTLDISLRQLFGGETYPKEVVRATLLMGMEQSRRCGYIANVCVARSARRQGIASSLLEVAIEAAKSWKLKEVYVHVNVGNIAAQQLYMKTGFQVVEEAVSHLSLEQKLLVSRCV